MVQLCPPAGKQLDGRGTPHRCRRLYFGPDLAHDPLRCGADPERPTETAHPRRMKRGDVLLPMVVGLALGAVAFGGAVLSADLLVGGNGSSGLTVVKGAAHLGLDAAIAAAERSFADKEKTKIEKKPKRGPACTPALLGESKK
ncbi:hypothetical protein CSHISOI_02763 [Colletotrichum shisoi]|uniref:Uncharacterized protein n=1 Tax=Colletotrichum shisoi TaxID=2078593 RepID=A0A5Q4C0U1_9PEZI|nr:hypothetical protein CSHISOI_02763 [Colletotrichum shisoi]